MAGKCQTLIQVICSVSQSDCFVCIFLLLSHWIFPFLSTYFIVTVQLWECTLPVFETKGHCFCTHKSKCTWRRSMYFSDSRAHAISLFFRSGILPLNMLYFKYSAILKCDISLWINFEGDIWTEKMHNPFSTGNFCKKENKNSHFWTLPGFVWSPFPIFIVKSSKDSVIPAWIKLGDPPFDTKSGWSNRVLKLQFTGHHCN